MKKSPFEKVDFGLLDNYLDNYNCPFLKSIPENIFEIS